MQDIEYIFWEEDGVWMGYLKDFPDHWTQGKTLEDLNEHLRDLHSDLTSGQSPLTSVQKQDLERRLGAYEASPRPGSSWEEAKARLRKKDTADG